MTSAVSPARKDRARGELVNEVLFHPLARVVVALLLPLRTSPVAVVVLNALAGLAAAVEIWRGDLVGGAVLLQLKTVLDNSDGRLARASGRPTVLGRYLDTEADLVVNAAVFVALARVTGAPALAAVAFLGLTLVLSANFNADVLYRRARGRGIDTQPSAQGEGRLARALAAIYAAVFAPHDRALQAISRRRLERILDGVESPDVRLRVELAYHDSGTTSVLANFGLSTQLAVLGVCLVAQAPGVYLWIVLGCAAALPLLQLRREHSARAALRAVHA